MRKCNLKGKKQGYFTTSLGTANYNKFEYPLSIGNHTADFPNKTIIHNKQIAAYCLKEQFGVLLSLIPGSAITPV